MISTRAYIRIRHLSVRISHGTHDFLPRYVGGLSSEKYRALFIKYRALFIEYRALFIEYRALFIEYRALFMKFEVRDKPTLCREMGLLIPAHEGDQTSNTWISRSTQFPSSSFWWRGLRLLTWKLFWNCWDSRENVFDMRQNLLEMLAVVIIVSPIPSVRGVRVAKTHRMPYLYSSFSAKEPYN